MEFWGVEVKAGKPLTVTPEMGKLIHISQAALGEGKREKGSDIIPLRVNINDSKYVVGSLSAEKFPQISFDLVFEKEFELSHDWKNGSVYFCGYMACIEQASDDEFDSDSEDEEEEIPLPSTESGKVELKAQELKPAAAKVKAAKPESSAKPKVTLVEPKKDKSESDDSGDSLDDDDDDTMDADSDSDDISGSIDDDDSSEDDDDDSDDSDEETPTPKKPLDKKRPNGSASNTPVPAKKNKVDSAQKTDGKKGGHVATPHPSKKAEKSPATGKQTPKSDAKISCNSCPKKFTSDGALQSHTKAKHAAK